MSKDQWIAEYERIGDDFAGEFCNEDEARDRLKSLGLTHEEIENHIDALYEDTGFDRRAPRRRMERANDQL